MSCMIAQTACFYDRCSIAWVIEQKKRIFCPIVITRRTTSISSGAQKIKDVKKTKVAYLPEESFETISEAN